MMLQSFEFIVSDVIPANLQNFSHQVFFAYFCKFYEKKPLQQSFMVFLTISQKLREITEFWMIKVNLDVSDVIHMN